MNDKNKIYISEPSETNAIKSTEDGFTIKLENGVEIIYRENGVVIRTTKDDGTDNERYIYKQRRGGGE